MTMSKKIFIGSLFEFSKLGADEAIEKFRQALPNSSSAPFITYDKTRKVFTCSIDNHNSTAQTQVLTQNLTAALGAFIEFQNGKQKDLVDVSRLQGIDGTFARDEIQRSRALACETPALLEYDQESQDSDENSSLDNITTYWRPEEGDFQILTNDIAAAVADSTNCVLIAEPLEKRIRLVSGDTQSALSRLNNLEHLMTLAARHRSPMDSNMNANVIVLRNRTKDESIKFVRLDQLHCGYSRIILDPSQKTLITKSMVIESRFREPTGIKNEKPVNLDLVHIALIQAWARSSKFTASSLVSYGKAMNADPQTTFEPPPQSFGAAQRLSLPSKFMGSTEANRVTEWSQNVDPEAGVDLAPPLPIPDEPNFIRRRVVAEDSDDSDDSEDSSNEDVAVRSAMATDRRANPIPLSGEADGYLSDQRRQSSAERSTFNEEFREDEAAPGGESQNHITPSTQQEYEDEYQRAKTGNENPRTSNKFGALSENVDESSYPQNYTQDAQSVSALIDFDSDLQDSARVADTGLFEGGTHDNRDFQVVTKGKKSKFDPEKYGTKSHQKLPSRYGSANHNRSNIGDHGHFHQTHKPTFNSHDGRTVQFAPRSGYRGRGKSTASYSHSVSHQHGRGRGKYRDNHAFESKGRKDDLIDVSANSTGELPKTPPGFSLRSGYQGGNLMDTAADKMEVPALPSPSQAQRTNEWLSENVTSMTMPTEHLGYTPRLTPSRRNMEVLRQQTLARLASKMQQADGDDQSLPPERIRSGEESDSRKYHETMNQQAPNSAKKKNSKTTPGQQESKKEREARIAKAKAEAYGEMLSAGSAALSKEKLANAEPEKTSARKNKLIRTNPTMAAFHADTHTKQVLDEQTEKMSAALNPIFEAARAFSGELTFEVQIGQAVVIRTESIKETLHKQKDWTKLLDPASPSCAPVKFTPILTTNGQEVDQALELQAADDLTLMWSKDSNGVVQSVFEILCQDKSGSTFTVTLDTAADSYTISKAKTIIGKVALHCPDQIWDACATLYGSTTWATATEEIKEGVTQLIASIYVPPAPSSAAIYYRQPLNNSFSVQDVSLRRSSVHSALAADANELQIRITEVQALIHTTHPRDKGLHRSHEAGYGKMVDRDRIHYTMSVMNHAINRSFSEHNAVLEIGSLTDPSCTGPILLKQGRLRKLIETTTHMIDRIDWLGANNNGTYRRTESEDRKRQHTINASIPPQALTQVGPATTRPVYMGASIAAPPTNIPGNVPMTVLRDGAAAMSGAQAPRIIHGVRANTTAELYCQDGQYFYLGVNGARVPAPNAQGVYGLSEAQMTSDLVMPDDSASQAGGSRMRGTYRSARGRGRLANIWENKPDGYW